MILSLKKTLTQYIKFFMTDNKQNKPSETTSCKTVVYPKLDTIDSEFSLRITALRFSLAVFVVFIHNQLDSAIHFSDGDFIVEMPIWIQIIHDIFINYLGGIAVPVFFIISGYLFFAKPKPIVVTFKSKFKRIVLPYILWTLIAILLFFIAQRFEFSKPYFSQPEKIISNWGMLDYFRAFWAWDTSIDLHPPFVSPFWYVRNLIIMMLISPLIKIFAGKFPTAFFISITVLNSAEMLHITNIQYGFTKALFYYSLGYYAVKNIGKIIKWIDSIPWLDFVVAYITSSTLTVYACMNALKGCSFVSWFNLLFSICFAIKVAGIVCKNKKIFGKLSYLSGFSFWIFAAHLPFILPVMRKLSVQIIPMHGIWILVQFFGIVIICVGFLLILGVVVKKFLPKVYALLNGER